MTDGLREILIKVKELSLVEQNTLLSTLVRLTVEQEQKLKEEALKVVQD